jgi:hypothetical protein
MLLRTLFSCLLTLLRTSMCNYVTRCELGSEQQHFQTLGTLDAGHYGHGTGVILKDIPAVASTLCAPLAKKTFLANAHDCAAESQFFLLIHGRQEILRVNAQQHSTVPVSSCLAFRRQNERGCRKIVK